MLLHYLWRACQRGYSYHFNKSGLGQLLSPFHQKMHKVCPWHMKMGLTLHLQSTTKKEVILICSRQWKKYVSNTITYNIILTASYSGSNIFLSPTIVRSLKLILIWMIIKLQSYTWIVIQFTLARSSSCIFSISFLILSFVLLSLVVSAHLPKAALS